MLINTIQPHTAEMTQYVDELTNTLEVRGIKPTPDDGQDDSSWKGAGADSHKDGDGDVEVL